MAFKIHFCLYVPAQKFIETLELSFIGKHLSLPVISKVFGFHFNEYKLLHSSIWWGKGDVAIRIFVSELFLGITFN